MIRALWSATVVLLLVLWVPACEQSTAPGRPDLSSMDLLRAPALEAAGPGDAARPRDAARPTDSARPTERATLDGGRPGDRNPDSKPPPNAPLLGVYTGNDPNGILDFESWLGRKVDGILGYTGNASWQDYDGSVGWAIGVWSALDRRVLWSVPLIPTGATLDDAANGYYNSHYLQAAQQLAKFRPQEPVLYIRTAWEWNGSWFPWAVAHDKVQAFIGAWQQFVNTFRSASNRFRFDWCPSIGTVPFPWEEAYPGDSWVDVIGIDIYDEVQWCGIQDPVARWDFELNRDHGLNWLSTFAAQHGKPMSVAEWGVGGNGSGDNPVFVEKMHDWVMSHNVVYQTYWNSNSDYPGMLSNNQYPNASAKYRALFGP